MMMILHQHRSSLMIIMLPTILMIKTNNGDSEDNDGKEDTGDGPSMIPFP
jgi:hypothetical protein